MKKSFMIIVLFLFFTSIASAHTGLESSTPEADETVTYSVSKITLRFDTAIEPSSEVTVTDGNGTGITINDTIIDNNIMTVQFADSLTTGTYDVVWNIVGEDGHIIEDTYSFSVETEETTGVSPDTDTDSAEEEPVSELAEESPETESAVTSEERNLVPIAAGVMGGIIVVTGFFFLKRKKNNV